MACYRSFLNGLIIGGGLGAAWALLYAPSTGRETREKLSEEGRKLKDKAAHTLSEYRGRGEAAYVKARETLDSTAEGLKAAGKVLVEEGRETEGSQSSPTSG